MSYTVKFIATGIFMSLTVGFFIALCIINTITKNGKSTLKWIAGIVLAIAIGYGISGLFVLENKGDDEKWNNGYCTEYNEPYSFASSDYHKNGENEYYYTCDKCGHTIIIHELKER